LRRLFNRARMDEHELQILRGLLAAVEPDLDRSARPTRKLAARSDGDQPI
jgi:tRNA C32,U32 (ribose-2'-O)-methylase TrmJ